MIFMTSDSAVIVATNGTVRQWLRGGDMPIIEAWLFVLRW